MTKPSRAARLFVLVLFLSAALAGQETQTVSVLADKLRALPGVVEVKPVRFDPRAFKEAFEVMFEQPLDHRNPLGDKFRQRFFVAHAGFEKPVLLETEGYSAGGVRTRELTRILEGNQIVVEHRFFGRSVPPAMKWEFLTIRQSADDLHAVVTALKALYPGPWVSSGSSKGGQTTLFFKTYYPNDVDASVPYVAPINVAQEDPRLYRFLDTVGDAAARQKVKDYQIAMFKREDEILPMVKILAEKQKWTFAMGLSAAYEYGVLEYKFAFWQYGNVKPADIPAADAPARAMFDHLNKTNAIFYYSDQGKKAFEPFQYQAYTEIGYYNYDITDFKPYMKTLKDPSNRVLCPDGVPIVYDPRPLSEVYQFLQYRGDRIISIYGELDPWGATAVPLIGRTDAVTITVKDGYHGARIADFSPEQKELFYSKMERWLGRTLKRL